MITCKLCGTTLEKRNLRRDGSMLCPVCGQIYWKAAVDRALASSVQTPSAEEYISRIERESRRSVERIRRARVA